MSSSLAFDKQGKPFAFHRRTKQLLVRLFRNPSARGTCCQVLDADGEPLHIDPESDYMEFRKAVGQVPGLYRLDQCDEDGNGLDDAQAAYVSIDVARNAQTSDGGSGDVSPLVIIQQMAVTQGEVMKAMAAQHGALMAAAAEILRAPYRPAPAVVPAPELRNADVFGEDDEDEDEDQQAAPDHPATAALRMLEPHLPVLGGFLYEKFAELLRHIHSNKAAPPAATPGPMPVPASAIAEAAPHRAGEPVGVAADWSQAPATPTPTADDAAPVSTVPETSAPASPVSPGTPAATVAPTTPATTMAAPPMAPTREQFAHLYAIRERLSPKERAIAEAAISRMDPAMLAHWLAELSAMSVDDATSMIGGMVAQLEPPGGSKGRVAANRHE